MAKKDIYKHKIKIFGLYFVVGKTNIRQSYTIFFALVCFSALGQETKEMNPTLGLLIDKSLKGEIEYINQKTRCDEFWLTHQSDFDTSKFTASEKKLYEDCEEETLSY